MAWAREIFYSKNGCRNKDFATSGTVGAPDVCLLNKTNKICSNMSFQKNSGDKPLRKKGSDRKDKYRKLLTLQNPLLICFGSQCDRDKEPVGQTF